MRIWDVSPGYLDRLSLLGEHREAHALYAVLTEGKRGYSRHPETLRWVGAEEGLAWRHLHLAAEMRLRGFTDRTPIPPEGACGGNVWPETFVTDPAGQLALLRTKYGGERAGRMALPRNAQEMWAQHKYSVMARSPESYRRMGRSVAELRPEHPLDDVARELVALLRLWPASGTLRNAVEHMWGHVRAAASRDEVAAFRADPLGSFPAIQRLALALPEPYLLASTALSDLAVFAAIDDSGMLVPGDDRDLDG